MCICAKNLENQTTVLVSEIFGVDKQLITVVTEHGNHEYIRKGFKRVKIVLLLILSRDSSSGRERMRVPHFMDPPPGLLDSSRTGQPAPKARDGRELAGNLQNDFTCVKVLWRSREWAVESDL